jgi:hypothetical protein
MSAVIPASLRRVVLAALLALAVLAALALIPLTADEAMAQPGGNCVQVGATEICRDERPGGDGGDGGDGGGDGGGGGGGGGGPSAGPIYTVLRTTGFTNEERTETGECWQVVVGGSWTYGTAMQVARDRGPCYGGPATPSLVEVQRTLPAPTASVAPDATWVVGLPVYLEIEVGDIPPFPGDAFVVDTTRRLLVDWGDGEEEEEVESLGGPYPDGDVTHEYADAGRYTITVHAEYSSRWRLPGEDTWRPLGTVRLSDTVEVPVREVQAIRRR